MLTKLTIRNFKVFDEVEIELGERVVFIGPNNSGKTSALQALALWEVGVKRWLERRGSEPRAGKRSGVAINRQDIVALPIPSAKFMWRDLHVRELDRSTQGLRTQNIRMEVVVEGVSDAPWVCALEFDYANDESIYCRPPLGPDGNRLSVPSHLASLSVAYLPPISGLAAREDRLEMGSIRVRLGEGRTAEVLRNLCWQVVTGEDGPSKWSDICAIMESLFGSRLETPRYVPERGEIELAYKTRNSGRLDISCTGRGEQQTLLLLSHMAAHPGAILLLDEPDAHLEILRQRQIYNVLSEQASKTGAQVIAASHSEVLLNEAATRDIVVAFVGRPHRIDNRGSRVRKALTDVSFDQYYQAEQTGWILYLEGSTDLHILRTLAKRLSHPAEEALSRPFVQYVGNQPRKAQEHFHALREAKSDLLGLAIYDRLEQELPQDPWLKQHMWSRRELENYICQRETLLSFAESRGQERVGPLFGSSWRQQMEQSLEAVESALRTLGKNPWGDDIKASDEFLAPLFQQFYDALGLPNEMMKSNFHLLAAHVAKDAIHPEIVQVLDSIHTISRAAHHAREGDTAAT